MLFLEVVALYSDHLQFEDLLLTLQLFCYRENLFQLAAVEELLEWASFLLQEGDLSDEKLFLQLLQALLISWRLRQAGEPHLSPLRVVEDTLLEVFNLGLPRLQLYHHGFIPCTPLLLTCGALL